MLIRHILILADYGLWFKEYEVVDSTKDNLKVKNKETGKMYDLRY
ncbi:MAG: hypothetical protein ACLR60_08590 [Clostridium paraputrificum]